ncbi:hypothetical protein J3L16_09375 [Alteromonas sp. 5E99-2]|uniref:hypothetical protein n=1 Tax=Alteromonas sp. 5E99-2 TaxID=2817683 RepID=UPI001A99B28B|nr:hypothetical protein [Alteromonas sp. 5E99-2]MBO1255892.1 hypothetical protein [Alteromonas sp. 5E99-2]
MKRILIVSFILTASFLNLSNAHAFSGHNSSKFEQKLSSAYQHPNQFSAAINWRLNNRHIDLGKQVQTLKKFGWHPSVVAIISNPQLFNYAVNQRTQPRRLQQSYARNQWDGKRNSRNSYDRKSQKTYR